MRRIMLASGTRLGVYEILGSLGAGGMGEVYRARDPRLGREVAIKVLPAEVAANAERLVRFEREARTVAALNHPNIVTLFSVENEGGIHFLTMEVIEGQTLSRFIAPGGLPLGRVLALAIPLADALVAAHERGVVHRDLKPRNVMVTKDERVKVVDFGLAKATALDPEETRTGASVSREGQVLGTVPYMAPEQLRGEAVDARSDLFALGIIMYELATGRRPFTGDSSAEIASSILRDTPDSLGRVRADLPRELERIVGECLEKNARERTQTALDVSNALRRLRKAVEHGIAATPESTTAASIAVLPFVNRSQSADDEYFSDGLTDELVNVLARIKGLRVTARTSSFHFKGKDVTLTEVGKALNVATVLEGSVRKAGNRVRISAELVQISDGTHLWSQTYDRTLEDIFAVQDDIAQTVVKELRTALLGEESGSTASVQAKAEVARAAKGRGTDPEAHRLYLMARYLLDRMTRQDTEAAIQYLKQALALDPEFALAWAELSRGYMSEANSGWAPVAEGFTRAREAVERALLLEPNLAEGHAQLGLIQVIHEWDFKNAERSYARALELDPGNGRMLGRAGARAVNMGRFEEGVGLYRRALELDPLSAHLHTNLGFGLYVLGRFVEAEAAYRRALELAPQRITIHAHLALTLLAQGRGEEALAEAAKEPHESFRLWALAIIHHGMGDAAKSDTALKEEIEKDAEGGAYQIAEIYGARGEVRSAFEWLERAYANRDAGLFEMKCSPRFRSLHSDPRWGAFLKKMGLEG
jgi:serine/threonine protein kinase/tetratricopeptide (TPR) repeat protein